MLLKKSKVAASLRGKLSYAFSSQEAISCLGENTCGPRQQAFDLYAVTGDIFGAHLIVPMSSSTK